MNKQQLANKIWESANKMRSKIEANEYKDYILGFIFYKYLSDTEIKFLKENDYTDELLPTVTEEDADTVKWVQQNIGYFISYTDLFSTWISMGNDFDVSNVRDALSAFSRLISPSHKKVFDGVFDTLQTGLSKLGDSSGSQTKSISGLLQLIKDIPMDGKQDYDVLGFIYEYLISMFAANAGKKAGEFYTPHEVSLLMSEIVANHLKGKTEIKIYDPTSGSGSLLINIGRSVAKYISDSDNIKYYAQELKENTYNLTRMNLVMRGIKPDNIVTRNGDTLEEDWPYFDENDPVNTYNPLYVDAVVSNPPYSQVWDPTNKEADPRYARFGLAPKGKADYAFLLHDLFHIRPDGIMTIVLPHGVLFRGGEEGTIRKNLIENNHIDTIIGLPANIFFGTGIPTIIMVLKQKRENTDVLIVDASKGFIKEGKNNKLRASDIKRIADTVTRRISVPKFSRVVSREEIRNNEYNLNIPRYVDSSESAESWDIYASMFGGIPKSEIDELSAFWSAFPNLKAALFTDDGTPYVRVAAADIKSAIKTNADVVSFENVYNTAFSDFAAFLKQKLIDEVSEVEINRAEAVISEDIFARLAGIPLIDGYGGFQLRERRVHIGVYMRDACKKALEHAAHGRVQIGNVLLHSSLDVLISEVSGRDNGECRFQLRGHILFVMAGRELHIPKRDERQPHGQYRHKEHIAHHDGGGRADGEEQKGRGADRRELLRLAGGLEDALRLGDLPAEEGQLFAPGGLVDVAADASRSGGQALEHSVGQFHGGKPENEKSTGDHADAGNKLERRHALTSVSLGWSRASSCVVGIPFSMSRFCRLLDGSQTFS